MSPQFSPTEPYETGMSAKTTIPDFPPWSRASFRGLLSYTTRWDTIVFVRPALTYSPVLWSWDSRYFGPVTTDHIVGAASPVLVFAGR
jgi:hypothetical protein